MLGPIMPVRRRFAARAGIVALLAIGIAVLFLLDPSETRYFLHCPIFALTGLKCPGCGTSRAFHVALHCLFVEGLHFNAALPVLLALLSCCVIFPLRAQRPVLMWSVFAFIATSSGRRKGVAFRCATG